MLTRVALFVLLHVLVFVSSILAQRNSKNLIKVNPLSTAIASTVSLSYERVIARSTSLQLSTSYTYGMIHPDLDNIVFAGLAGPVFSTVWGYSIVPELRYYFSAHGAPEGWFLGPFLRYQQYEVLDPGITFSGSAIYNLYSVRNIGFGVIVGRQWVLENGIAIALFAGPYLQSANQELIEGRASDTMNAPPFVSNGFGLRAGVTVGYAF